MDMLKSYLQTVKEEETCMQAKICLVLVTCQIKIGLGETTHARRFLSLLTPTQIFQVQLTWELPVNDLCHAACSTSTYIISP